jgi:hypothetical protein
MSTFADLTALKAAIVRWSNRDDLDDALLTDFVRLAEEQIGLFLRSRFNRKTERVFVTGTATILKPTDYVELQQMQPVGTWDGLDTNTFASGAAPAMLPVTYDAITAYAGLFDQNAPINYAENPDGAGWLIYPTGDWAIDVSYYATLEPVSDIVQPDLFVQHGGIYLAASLIEVENYLKLTDAERGPWRNKLDAYISQLNKIQRVQTYAGGSLVSRAPYR